MNKVYRKLAFTNIKNNGSLYLPYIISGIVTVAMFYIMMFLNNSKGLEKIYGASYLTSIMALGVRTIAVFSYIFIFYTNSFIIKRRKKEIGVYNILGMEKRHIAKLMGIETVTVALIAIIGGIVTGILFSKLSILLLYKILAVKETVKFEINFSTIINTLIVFGILYALTLIYNMMQIKLANPIELLRGGNVGEKEPKSKWLMAIIAVGCLAVAYYIAITTENPLKGLSLFFVAVLLVIVGTYLLFIAGSIVFLKMLRKNKKFYYNKKHFAAVSGMIYRMKQNADGLASICILSTMVLVIIASTVSLYIGLEDELKTRYPMEAVTYVNYLEVDDNVDSVRDHIRQIIEGYDDKERYEIMEKVGMSNAEVKKSIQSQVRMVFFLPIVTAAIHVAAAFPMLRRLLMMLNLTDTQLMIECMIGTLLVFLAIYYLVFKLTSRTYYKIVGNQV